MTVETISDADGDRWPVTGLWCSVCGMPMHATCISSGTHPNCDTRPECLGLDLFTDELDRPTGGIFAGKRYRINKKFNTTTKKEK